MDPLKTVFIDSIPVASEDAISPALKPLGIVKWVPLLSGCGFAQFSSAAQVKSALEVLPMAGVSVTVSDDTKVWIARTAAKASVQNVTRMSPSYLANRIKSALGKAQAKAHEKPAAPTATAIVPDGTLETDDPKIWAEIRRFREQSLASRTKEQRERARGSAGLKRDRDGQTDPVNEPPSKELRHSKSAQSPAPAPASSAAQRSLEQLARKPDAKYAGLPSEHQPRASRTGSAPQSDPQSIPVNSQENKGQTEVPGRATSIQPAFGDNGAPASLTQVAPPTLSTPASSTPASSTPVSSTPVSSTPVSSTPVSSTPVSSTPVSSTPVSSTPVSSPQREESGQSIGRPADANALKPVLSRLVEEYFGVPDDDVVNTLESHIREKRPASVLASEFEAILEDDFTAFAQEFQKLSREND